MTNPTILADIEARIESAGAHLKALAEEDLPKIGAFIGQLKANPLVTSFAAVIPGELGQDAMAILNGLVPLLGALGAREYQKAQTPAPAAPTATLDTPGTATTAASATLTYTAPADLSAQANTTPAV